MKNLEIKSSINTNIPVSIIEGNGNKLLIMVHGFKASRFEDGRFISVGEKLSKYGFNSIMMTFPGCKESSEDFINYTLDNCLTYIDDCYKYMIDNYNIDKDSVGLIGYSMGGRLISLYQSIHKNINSMAYWAGFSKNLEFDEVFLGASIGEMINEAKEKGYMSYYNSFDDTYINLSYDFLCQIYDYKPEDKLKEFKGNVLIIQGDKDFVVREEVSKIIEDSLINAKYVLRHIVKDADHGFGAWDNRLDLSKELCDTTVEFFKEKM